MKLDDIHLLYPSQRQRSSLLQQGAVAGPQRRVEILDAGYADLFAVLLEKQLSGDTCRPAKTGLPHLKGQPCSLSVGLA